ncbi:MAG: hypothetical protein MMC23_000549 [Stictis urceolatum]|nr:hypothetical protein [Stictis urceolata]
MDMSRERSGPSPLSDDATGYASHTTLTPKASCGSNTSNQAPSLGALQVLPPEMRDQVYLALVNSLPKSVFIISPVTVGPFQPRLMSLLLASKSLYQECMPRFYQTNTFLVATHSLADFLGKIGERGRKTIVKVHVDRASRHFHLFQENTCSGGNGQQLGYYPHVFNFCVEKLPGWVLLSGCTNLKQLDLEKPLGRGSRRTELEIRAMVCLCPRYSYGQLRAADMEKWQFVRNSDGKLVFKNDQEPRNFANHRPAQSQETSDTNEERKEEHELHYLSLDQDSRRKLDRISGSQETVSRAVMDLLFSE